MSASGCPRSRTWVRSGSRSVLNRFAGRWLIVGGRVWRHGPRLPPECLRCRGLAVTDNEIGSADLGVAQFRVVHSQVGAVGTGNSEAFTVECGVADDPLTGENDPRTFRQGKTANLAVPTVLAFEHPRAVGQLPPWAAVGNRSHVGDGETSHDRSRKPGPWRRCVFAAGDSMFLSPPDRDGHRGVGALGVAAHQHAAVVVIIPVEPVSAIGAAKRVINACVDSHSHAAMVLHGRFQARASGVQG